MARPIVTGIDIGTYEIRVVICEHDGFGSLHVIGTGTAESRGIRHGYVTHPNEVSTSIALAVARAEEKAKIKIKRAFVAIGGIGLGSVVVQSSVIVSRADSEVTPLDLKKVHEQCEKDIPGAASLNRKILHSVPLHYKVDGKIVLGKPEGMKAHKLEVKMLFITCLEHHLNDVLQAVEESGVAVEDVMASPIAASLVVLSKSQKIAGCILANIGAETVSIAVFENNMPVSLEVFPIGSTDITNDIALGLKVPLEEAEQIKIGSLTGNSFPRRKLEEIIEARLSDIFELIEAHLKKIGRNGLLPAGIIITGGGSNLNAIEDMAKIALRLPSRRGAIIINPGERSTFKDSTWAVAFGLCIFGTHADEAPAINTGMRIIRSTKNSVIEWFKQFLP
ncbi:MAG: cell division protein FtsA [Patescibacteria group bacterium]